MKNVSMLGLLAILFFTAVLPAHSQMTDVIQVVSSSHDFEGIGDSTTVVKVLSYPTGYASLDLSSAETTGRRLSIVNYATYDILLSSPVRVDGALSAFIEKISKSPNIMNPLQNGVNVTIIYDGTSWIRL